MDNSAISERSKLKATCHCGAITLTLPSKPTKINECQCTICRRYGAAWSYYNTKSISINITPNTPGTPEGASMRKYIWGNKEASFNFCSTCGNMTHWWPITQPELESGGGSMMGVNTRMMDPEELVGVNREVNYSDLLQPLKCGEGGKHAEDKAEYR